jgi:hypothetical protein
MDSNLAVKPLFGLAKHRYSRNVRPKTSAFAETSFACTASLNLVAKPTKSPVFPRAWFIEPKLRANWILEQAQPFTENPGLVFCSFGKTLPVLTFFIFFHFH